ncbi:MAG TPA: DUF6049 family protein [Pedococcus sp.]|uniref:DUF6049 family protein n=1 Tax=Pedococcus sp. TaxID=2860345 RepID=UPI002F953694
MRGFQACRALTVAVLFLAGAALPTAPASAGAAPPAESTSPAGASAAGTALEISVSSISPAIARPGQNVTVTGTLDNPGPTAVPAPRVRVVLGDQPLATRKDVGVWAEGTGPAQGRVVGQQQVRAAIPPSGSVAFRVEIPGAAGLRSPAYGALPLSIEAGGSALHTFAGYQRQKEYEPLRVAWAVPLTIDGESDLFGSPGEARDAAWSRALGAGSRLARVVEATEASPVTWAIDPTLVPSLLPQEVEGSAEPGAPAPQPESAAGARTAMEQRIRASATEHTPWVLPDVDADLAAVADAGGGLALTSALVARSSSVASALGGRADIAWPADGRHTAARESVLRRLFADPPLAGQLAAQSTLPLTGGTQDAHRRSADGLPVLGYDDALSALLAQTTTPASAALSTQRFIADSAALLDERPGTPSRSVLVAAPRSFDPDPSGAAGLLRTAASIPWLDTVSTDELLRDARRAVPMPKQVGTRPGATTPPSAGRPGGEAGPPAAPRDPYAASKPLLNRARLQNLQENLRTIRGVATIREDGEEFSRIWGRASEQLASTRWRVPPARAEWSTLSRGVSGAIDETTRSITVSRSNINFLADTGRLQVTVANDLDVAVENVKLTLEPATPRLRIDSQPPVMRIGAKSRATAIVGVTTLAAGSVPLRTTLTTPDGTVIGQGADVVVQVTPTGDWVYWTLGGFAGIILVLGIWRSVRRKPEPVNAAEPLPTSQGTA